jgi:hypothetical protein
MFKVKAVDGGIAVVDSTHKIVMKVVLMGGVAEKKPATDVIQRVSLFAVLMTDRESHVRAAGGNPTSRVVVVLHSERAIDRIMVRHTLCSTGDSSLMTSG